MPGERRTARGRELSAAAARLWRELRGLRGRRLVAALAGAAVVVTVTAVLTVWTFWPSGTPPRARQYLAFTACLLTDAHGISGEQAAPVWSGMQKASLRTRARVQYLPAFGPATVANTQPYLRSLLARRCNVIVAVGDAPVAAVGLEAAQHPKTRFVVVADRGTAHNVTAISAKPPELTSIISDTISRSVHGH